MDGSLSRMRGKADFRLMRELLGLPVAIAYAEPEA